MYQQKSFVEKPQTVSKNWWLVDASGKTVGRLATEIAKILRGKNKPTFTPHTDCGDYVVVVNAKEVTFTGQKWLAKNYYWHTNHMGGLKSRTAQQQLEKNPTAILTKAVKGMLPKNSLGRQQLTKLKVYQGPGHEHEAQQPQPLVI